MVKTSALDDEPSCLAIGVRKLHEHGRGILIKALRLADILCLTDGCGQGKKMVYIDTDTCHAADLMSPVSCLCCSVCVLLSNELSTHFTHHY